MANRITLVGIVIVAIIIVGLAATLTFKSSYTAPKVTSVATTIPQSNVSSSYNQSAQAPINLTTFQQFLNDSEQQDYDILSSPNANLSP